jgi:putative ABC transport system permease protein
MARGKIQHWLASHFSRLRHHRTDTDLSDELKIHLEMQEADYVGAGIPVHEARRRARLGLGATQAIVENVRDQELITTLESCYRDFALGLRSLKKSPVFFLTAVLTLAVGIGANTVVFTLLHGLLLRSLPVRDAGSLVRIGVSHDATINRGLASSVPYHMLLQLRSQQKSFDDISAWSIRNIAVDTDDGSSRLNLAAFVSGNAFDVLGMNAYLGRLLTPADDVRGGSTEGWPAVLSYGLWQEIFAGDPSVLGKQIRISNTPVTVVGVGPQNFRGVWPGSEIRVYLPFQFLTVVNGRDEINPPNSFWWVNTIGRLKSGVSLAEARAELATYQRQLFSQFLPPQVQSRFRNPYLWVSSARTGLAGFFGQVYSKPLYMMQGLVGIVLLLCCVNVAGLMMSKVYSRRQEFAVRTAIGAARLRLIRQYLTESFVIALAGAALGGAAAWYGTGYLLPFFRHPNEGIGMAITPDTTTFFVTGLSAVMTTLLFGTVPAWRAGASDPGNLLKSRTTGASRLGIFGKAFIPLQVALSFALVSLATLLAQSLVRLETEQTGFDLDHVTIQTAPFHVLNLPAEARMELYQRMKTRLEQLPGINSVSFTWFTPMTSFQATSGFEAVSSGQDPPQDPRMAYNQVGPDYFRTMRTAILAGREFQDHERDRSVCILNQSAAAYLFPGQHALGQYVRSTDQARFPQAAPCRVVGLAQDAKFANLHELPPRTIYFPVTVETIRTTNLVFLLNSPAKAQAIAAYRTAKAELSPATPFVIFVTLREQMEAALGSQRALSLMSNFFAGLALLLSGLGLYGLLSSSVAQRTGEIGVRMAVGAQRSRVVGMILAEALRLLAAGLVLGALLITLMAGFVERNVYGVSTFEPLRLAAIIAVLAVVTIAASLLPALRAASVDPIQALRAE